MPKGPKHDEKVAKAKHDALIWAENLYHYKLIARGAGVTDDTLKKYRDDDLIFSEQLEQARIRFINKKIRMSKPEFLLERLEPDLFKQKNETNINIHLPTPILGGTSIKKIEGNNDQKAINP